MAILCGITAASFLLLSLIFGGDLPATCFGLFGKENGRRILGAGMKEMKLGSYKEEAKIREISTSRTFRDFYGLND